MNRSACCEGRYSTPKYRPTRIGSPLLRAQRRFRIVDLSEDAFAVAHETLARFREPHDARGAVKQARTDSRFEHCNAARHRGRRHRETACRCRETARFGDSDERSHGVETIHFHYCERWNSALSISAILVEM